jgi:hypothetical protein
VTAASPLRYKKTIVEEKTVEIELTRSALLEVFTYGLAALPEVVPEDAEIFFRIPGGGDYSHMDISLDDKETVLMVRWTTRTGEVQTNPVTPEEHNAGERKACLAPHPSDPSRRCVMPAGHPYAHRDGLVAFP